MIKDEILEYNKRCAEFLGISTGYFKSEIDCPTPEYKWMCVHANCTYEIQKENFPLLNVWDYLEFHSDWNWIVGMVEAIEKLYEHPDKMVYFHIKGGEIEVFQTPWYLEGNNYHEVIYLGNGYINNSKKEAVVEAINQFLIWYKENKNT